VHVVHEFSQRVIVLDSGAVQSGGDDSLPSIVASR